MVAEAAGAETVDIAIGAEDFWRDLPRIAGAMDDPAADYAIVPTFLLAEAVRREGLKVVLTGEGHAGQAYRLTGPAMMDFHEVAARMGTVLERPVSYVAQSPEAFREVLGQFIKSPWQLDAVCELFAEIAAGSLEEQTSTTADLLGRPAMDLETFTKQFAGAFAPAN